MKKSNILLLLFLIIPFFKPDIVVSITNLNYFFSLWQVISFSILIIIYIKENRISKFFIGILIFYLLLFVSTCTNNGNFNGWLVTFSLNLGMVMLLEIYIKRDKISILRILSIIYYVLVILNTLSFIIFPDGIAKTEYLQTPIYLLGIDNRFAFTYIPGLCIVAIYNLLSKNQLTKLTFIFFSITLSTLLYFWSAGALVAELMYVVYYIFIYKLNMNKLSRYYFYVAIVAFYSIVIIRIQKVFEFLIVDILHKDLTFTYRTTIWDKVFEAINQKALMGIGVQKSTYMIERFSAFHSHSNFLNIMLQGGYIGIGMYVYILYSVFAKLNKFKAKKIAQLIAFTLFDLLIMLIFDTFDITANLFLIMCLGYNIKYLVGKEEKSEE